MSVPCSDWLWLVSDYSLVCLLLPLMQAFPSACVAAALVLCCVAAGAWQHPC
jgi:hypothetical protein